MYSSFCFCFQTFYKASTSEEDNDELTFKGFGFIYAKTKSQRACSLSNFLVKIRDLQK